MCIYINQQLYIVMHECGCAFHPVNQQLYIVNIAELITWNTPHAQKFIRTTFKDNLTKHLTITSMYWSQQGWPKGRNGQHVGLG